MKHPSDIYRELTTLHTIINNRLTQLEAREQQQVKDMHLRFKISKIYSFIGFALACMIQAKQPWDLLNIVLFCFGLLINLVAFGLAVKFQRDFDKQAKDFDIATTEVFRKVLDDNNPN